MSPLSKDIDPAFQGAGAKRYFQILVLYRFFSFCDNSICCYYLNWSYPLHLEVWKILTIDLLLLWGFLFHLLLILHKIMLYAFHLYFTYILMKLNKPLNHLISSGLEIWCIENLWLVPISKSSHGKFYSGSAYIILNVSC